jgi:hypothetical protein
MERLKDLYRMIRAYWGYFKSSLVMTVRYYLMERQAKKLSRKLRMDEERKAKLIQEQFNIFRGW